MSNSTASDIKLPLKRCWKVGENSVVVIDKSLVKKLHLDEQNTIFQEEIVDDGIFLRIIKHKTNLGVSDNAEGNKDVPQEHSK